MSAGAFIGTRPCPRCGALNDGSFDRCIRCGAPLSARAVATDTRQKWLDGRSLPVAKGLIGLTLAVFAFQIASAMSHVKAEPLQVLLAGGPVGDAIRFGALDAFVSDEPWRVLSAVFVHFGLIHIGMNMLSLLNIARVAEPQVGSARFLVAYVVTGVTGFAATVLLSVAQSTEQAPTAGASGAVMGVLGLVIGVFLRQGDPRWKGVALQALIFGVLFGFAVNASGSGLLINNTAHIGGLVSGIVLGLVFGGSGRRNELWANACAALCVVACIGSIALAQLSPHGHRIKRILDRAAEDVTPTWRSP